MKPRTRIGGVPAMLLVTTLLATGWTSRATAQQLLEVGLLDRAASVLGEGKPAEDGCCQGPLWTFSADALFLERSRPDAQVLVADAFAGTPYLNASALGYGFQTGWDLALTRQTEWGSVEGRFFSIDGWDAAASTVLGGPTDVLIPNAIPFGAFPNVTTIDATSDSELLSFELNLRRDVRERVAVLAGFRMLELDEHYRVEMNAAAFPTTYDTLTRNRLYGAQIGADAAFWCRGPLSIDGLAKIGIYHNSSAQNTILDTGITTAVAADTSDRAAFVGELGFTGSYRVNDCLTVRAGYELFWIETVALATDQVPAVDFTSSNGIAAGGGAFYHGAFAGLEYRR